ncbi:MAG: response regulator [Lachnospiraceae bacterium]|nr:response regulator [Robinsoniella sp.]MDY3765233.1 response regulator [Lachnospiraceae bacterium]
MDFLKILLVDDEEQVREIIAKKIDWEKIGYELIGSVSNGREALEMIEANEPDVVLTDVRMPFMDGLELAATLKEEYADIKVVIFSGFDEFEYVKEALRYHVIDYILKPINIEELMEVLQKIRRSIVEDISKKRDLEQLREVYLKGIPVLREHFLTELIHGKVKNREEIYHKMSQYQIPMVSKAGYLVVTLMMSQEKAKYSGDSMDEIDWDEMQRFSVKQYLEEMIQDEYASIFLRTASGWSVILGLEQEDSGRKVTMFFNHFCHSCQKLLDVEITAGVGSTVEDVTEIPISYQESKEALGYYRIMGKGKAIYIQDVEPGQSESLLFEDKLEDQLVVSMKFGTEEKVCQCVDEIVDQAERSKIHDSHVRIYYISLVINMLKFAEKCDLHGGDGAEILHGYIEQIFRIKSAAKMKELLKSICVHIQREIGREREDATLKLINKAKAFIEIHYQEPSLSVEMICQELHISAAYFSTIFKKEVGESYVSYLTNLRLKKALELLKDTTEKTYVIAEKVGYSEPNYFSYVFKKKYGVAPSKYYKSLNSEEKQEDEIKTTAIDINEKMARKK